MKEIEILKGYAVYHHL